MQAQWNGNTFVLQINRTPMWLRQHVVEGHDKLADSRKQVFNDKIKEILPTYADMLDF